MTVTISWSITDMIVLDVYIYGRLQFMVDFANV